MRRVPAGMLLVLCAALFAAPAASAATESRRLRLEVPNGPLEGTQLRVHVTLQVKQDGRLKAHVNGQLRLTTDGGPPWDAIVPFNARLKTDLDQLEDTRLTLHARLIVPGEGHIGRVRIRIDLSDNGSGFSIAEVLPELSLYLMPIEIPVDEEPIPDPDYDADADASGTRLRGDDAV